MNCNIRLTLDLSGILQGVGFRPTLARLVSESGLSGWIRNQSSCVRLVLTGREKAINEFVARLPGKLPEQARLETMRTVSREELAEDFQGEGFMILESKSANKIRVSIPADLAVCEGCKSELFDPKSRYYGYPFVTCTNCGPRYTVVDGMPYDRKNTTLRDFPLCNDCLREYEDPFNRRFHAQSIACFACGPSLYLHDANGTIMDCNPLFAARKALADGKIVAVKGLGGFLLAADASNEQTLATLRERKNRPHKPFAVMAGSVAQAQKYCAVSSHEEELLTSSKAPIVILDQLASPAEGPCLNMLAPGNSTLGVMLPTTPLHLLLATPLKGDPTPVFDLLVMTSGNRGGEPICITNDEAFDRLTSIADFFLCHDRNINLRNDDSIAVSVNEKMQLWRRARGFAPRTLAMKKPFGTSSLAFGAELKNTIALGFQSEIVISPHVGDLETPEALDGMQTVVECLPAYFDVEPQRVIVDLHPDMHSTRTGKAYAESRGIPVFQVQHHHAHAAACMAEHGLDDAIALVFDGTGLGSDGTIWGGELLHVYPRGYKRLGTFAGVPLPGGDAAVAHPARQLIGRWLSDGLNVNPLWYSRLGVSEEEFHLWTAQAQKNINSPTTHAAGRLFDAFSALIGVSPRRVTYEGQAAIGLEAVAATYNGACTKTAFDIKEKDSLLTIDFSPTFHRYAQTPPSVEEVPALAMSFHQAVSKAAVSMVDFGIRRTGCRNLVLTGGVMMNRILCNGIIEHLKKSKIDIFLPGLVPPNDGGISLGQIYALGGTR